MTTMMIKIMVGMVLGAGLLWGYGVYTYRSHPVIKAGVYVNVCPTKKVGVLWFMSNGRPVMEWIDTQEAADKAAEIARWLPNKSKGTLIVPCPRLRVE